ncbi:sigma-54-dependent transcriptional regulator [Algoriphagus litoralis]|uniref:sigma-54-dependent transcriptional regulator n=1 Tax=Algoriphagus litoralis TaxID=2202829 RepID=UPI000DBAA5E7|nr:sigma-54 dependent transcriptional regulator [Algoriphagus litoralis]
MKRILVADNQLSHRDLLQRFLSKNNFTVETAATCSHAIELLNSKKFDIIISEYLLPDMEGTAFFEKCRLLAPEVQFIFMSREVNLKCAINLIRKGVHQFLEKPLNPDELLEIIQSCENSSELVQQNSDFKSPSPTPKPTAYQNPDIVYGNSKKAKWMIKQAQKVGNTNFTVLIEGETGTGKESLARLIHQESPRKEKPFVAVDCGSLSREIAGSELFGHEKGAFTGALNSKTGFFEQAEGGTIFLDEIANLPMEIQISLLRALQEKVIRKVGGSKEIPIDVRIIAATNEDLLEKSQEYGFREDLLFRLNEFVLKVPALRERMDDFPLFVEFFLEQTAKELNQPKPKLGEGVMEYFTQYFWPGNIRELRNVIRRCCLFVNRSMEIQVDSLPHRILVNKSEVFDSNPKNYNRSIPQPLRNPEPEDLKTTAARAESQRILEVLKDVQYNKTKAAEVLNIHRKTLYSKLKQINMA